MNRSTGGYLRDIPHPHRRMWPGHSSPRRVSIDVFTWRGISADAVHYYLRIDIEDNPLWDSRTDAWRVAWDDDEAKVEREEYSFLTSVEAIQVAEKIITERGYDGPGWKVVAKGWILKRRRSAVKAKMNALKEGN